MQNITSSTELKNAIQLLEIEHAVNEQLLNKQFHIVYESLKPINLIKNTLKEITSSPYLVDNILGATVGLATGYISKKIFVGTSDNMFRKLLGSVLQFGITNVVAQNADSIKSVSQSIFQRFFHKKI